jgi:hypothetical protein
VTGHRQQENEKPFLASDERAQVEVRARIKTESNKLRRCKRCNHYSFDVAAPKPQTGDNLKVPEKGENLDDKLKELMQELGNAINESLSDSDRIAGAIGEIKRAGYDVFLVLEATIGFNKRDGEDSDEDSVEIESDQPVRNESTGKIRLTTQDHKFLRALKISVNEEEQK